MSRIIYKPTCSNCGAIISGEVRYTEEPSREDIITFPIRHISPTHCTKCGTYFDCIVTPWYKSRTDFKANMDEAERWSE